MQNNNEPGHTILPGNAEYAKDWIEYLQKKNARLNIVWPLLLILSITLLLAAFYFFQNAQLSTKQVEETSALVSQVQAHRDDIAAKLQALESENQSMAQEISLLQAAKKNLEEQKGDSIEQLDLSSKMTETLQETLRALETENNSMVAALGEAKQLLIKQEQHYSEQIANLEVEHEQSRQLSTKALTDRKTAYNALVNRQREMQSEIDRLTGIVTKQKTELQSGEKTRHRQQQELKEFRREITKLKQEKQQLQQSLLEAEIAEQNATKNDRKESSLVTNDGLDEIRAPAITKPTSVKESTDNTAPATNTVPDNNGAFDYDSIVTD